MAQLATAGSVARWRPRSDVELVHQQLTAIERSSRQLHAAASADTTSLSREARLDASRERDVLQRRHEAVAAHVHRQLVEAGEPWSTVAPRRVVVAHRNAWFAGKLCEALGCEGVRVVALLDNGADAVGVALAEQPDLVLVEDALPMVPGPRVVAEVRDLCPATVVAAQVDHSERLSVLLDAGAVAAFVRRQPPAEVAAVLLDLLRPDA